MIDDELRAAAEWLLSWVKNDPADVLHRGPAGGHVVDVCNHILTHHPADDGEPVSGEWLEAVGFEAEPPKHVDRRWRKTVAVHDHGDGGITTHWLSIHEPIEDVGGNLWWPINFWQQHTGDEKPDGVALLSWIDHTTRGAIRRLLAALGVPALSNT